MPLPFEILAGHLSLTVTSAAINDIRALLARENKFKGVTSISRDEWEVLFACADAFYADLCRWSASPEVLLQQANTL